MQQERVVYWEVADMPADPLWCRWCQKRFAKDTVFRAHLTGKKHLKALCANGRVVEAEALKRKAGLVSERDRAKKAKTQAKDAIEAEKKKLEDEKDAAQKAEDSKDPKNKLTTDQLASEKDAAAIDEDDLTIPDVLFTPASTFGGARANYAFKLGAEGQGYYWDEAEERRKVSLKAKIGLGPNGVEWWKGTTTIATGDKSGDVSDCVDPSRVTSKVYKPSQGPGSGSGDWQCQGNYRKLRECGEWNYKNHEKCFKCGTYKRLS